jgi:hypothetical protein
MYRREFLKTAASCLGALGFAKGSWGAQFPGVDAGSSKAALAGGNGIYLNQIGFLPDRPKVATVSAHANSFLVRSLKGNSVAFRSALSPQLLDDASRDTVRFADFSSVRTPGEYCVELDTGVSSDSFPIREDAYDRALLLTMRSFYGQRCGFEVNLGGGYAHPKCHMQALSTRPPEKCSVRYPRRLARCRGLRPIHDQLWHHHRNALMGVEAVWGVPARFCSADSGVWRKSA